MSRLGSVAEHLTKMAAERPDALAIVVHDRRGSRQRLTYRALENGARAVARGLSGAGLERGARAVLMVPPSLELFQLVFGFFHAGVVPVMVDPGMGTASLKTCLGRAEPHAFVGVPRAHLARRVLGWAPSARTAVVVGAGALASRALGGVPFADFLARGAAPTGATAPDDEAAILFTSGSTGVPKGAVYRHRNFDAQVASIRDLYDIAPGEIDLPTFPLFALFDPALGMTTVLPEMDYTRPASVDPARLAAAVEDFRPTNLFGSPALLDTVSRWAAPRGHVFSSLRRVISAGAPVAPRILARMVRCLPEGARIHTPYGATESLPIASIDHREILGETGEQMGQGAGICVGRPVPSAEVLLMQVRDEAIAAWDPDLAVPEGSVGEIAVAGPQVTEAYFGQDDETARHKLRKDGRLFHRTGDVGYRDGAGRLWYCGRKSQRVRAAGGDLYTERLEGPFNAHPKVKRSALVGVPRVRMQIVVCIEPDDRTLDPRGLRALEAELSEVVPGVDHVLASKDPFPVDIRHNAKIGREKLAVWADIELARRGL
jgi:acyl-CoA synthetase (AMP-forming)/AMP-acid ligase II